MTFGPIRLANGKLALWASYFGSQRELWNVTDLESIKKQLKSIK